MPGSGGARPGGSADHSLEGQICRKTKGFSHENLGDGGDFPEFLERAIGRHGMGWELDWLLPRRFDRCCSPHTTNAKSSQRDRTTMHPRASSHFDVFGVKLGQQKPNGWEPTKIKGVAFQRYNPMP
jgi:hypothetical protein